MFAEERDYATKQRARMNVADEPDEVADLGIKKTQARRRIGLRMRRIGKVADRFKADHRGDFVAARPASAGVNEAAHFIRQKVRRLLVRARNKAQRAPQRSTGKAPRQP